MCQDAGLNIGCGYWDALGLRQERLCTLCNGQNQNYVYTSFLELNMENTLRKFVVGLGF